MTGDRDEFTAATKQVLALRAAHRCSRCRILTVRPHSDSGRAVITGVAAHICAAADGGPRFDPDQAQDERRAPANGIWVCHDCSDLIDKDQAAFPIDMLRMMKLRHEQWVSQEDFVPALPTVSIQTYAGLALPTERPATITGEMIEKYRDHAIEIAASSRHELVQMKMRVQFPESVITASVLEQPVGLGVSIRRETTPWVANASGDGSVTVQSPMSPSNCFVIEQEKVVPARPLRFMVRSVQSERLVLFLRLGEFGEDDDAPWSTYAEGTFLYADQEQFFERAFVLRLIQGENRAVSAQPPEELNGQRRREVSGFGF